MTARLYKITGPNGAACHGGSGRWHLPRGKRPGKWMSAIPDLLMCRRGYHVCTASQALGRWLAGVVAEVYEVETRGKSISSGDKLCVEQARLVGRLRWDDTTARLFAADCAARVLHVFEAERRGDDRPRNAIVAARAYARGEIGAAARDAVWVAARDAAAAQTAVRAAAWAAAWAAGTAVAEAAARAAAAAWAAAWYAAGAAARAAAAAGDAAWYAAGAAARDAERRWQTRRLIQYWEGRVKHDTPFRGPA